MKQISETEFNWHNNIYMRKDDMWFNNNEKVTTGLQDLLELEYNKLSENIGISMGQEDLYKKYPILFRQKELSMQQSCMYWGISCDNGWYPIIDELSEHLSKFDGIEYTQIKEKFGRLCIYVDYNDSVSDDVKEKCQALINEASLKSLHVCEICGNPGKIRTNNWVRTLCDVHETLRK